MLERIHEYLQFRRLSYNKFEKSLGVSHGSISNARKNKKNIGSKVIIAILNTYSDMSAEWLLRGEGEMLKKNRDDVKTSSLLIEKEFSDWLIFETIKYLDLKDKLGLVELLKRNSNENDLGKNDLEQRVLDIWEKKYGQEFSSMKLQLITLFTSKLDKEKEGKINTTNTRTG